MRPEIHQFFDKEPAILPLYLSFEEVIWRKYPDARIKVHKTQISFSNRYGFLYVWLPVRPMKNRPKHYLVVSFGSPHQIESPRIAEAVEPYPGRWTHHVILEDMAELDEELLRWIDESYHFSMAK